jgi:chemotaxis protein MotA
LKIRIREGQVIREMMLEGVVSILEGMNPRMIETKLFSYLAEIPVPAREQEQQREQGVEAS